MDLAGNSWLARLWHHTSLVQRMAFVALVPTLVTAALLVTLLTQRQLGTLRRMAQSNADAIATQTASVSVQPLRAMRLRELLRIADSIGELPHVTRVQIRTADGQILADHRAADDDERDVTSVVREVVDNDDQATPRVLGSVLVDVSLRDAVIAQRATLRHALVALLLSLLVAGVIGWQVARWISAPLRRLAGAVGQLDREDEPVSVPVTDRTEIGELQRGFNHAAAALFESRRGLHERIEEATRELALKNAALEAASEARSRFLAAAAHDLRQPLYALTLFSAALALDEHDPRRLDRIAHIQECVHSLDHLFGELLDLSRLEAGAVQVEISEFPLNQVFEEVSRTFSMVAEQRGLELRVHPVRDWVRTDRTMLTRMLNNLVNNALRFTHRGGALIGARLRGDRLRIEVWDTGSGIAAEHLPHVFDEFYRIDDHTDAGIANGSQSGLGLGLATVQRLAQLLDTVVEVDSRPRRGSVFHFELPLASAQMLPPPPAVDEPAGDLAGRRVLVLDDDPAILSGIRFLLDSWGCDVAVAEDHQQAQEAIENWPAPVDIVICDLHLRSGERGTDLFAELDRLYERDGEARFARLLVTGETRAERLQDVLAGKLTVLYKPVSPQRLRSAMLAALAARDGT